MNVQTIPSVGDRIDEIRIRTAEIIDEDILLNENKLWAWREAGSVDEEVKREAKKIRAAIQAGRRE